MSATSKTTVTFSQLIWWKKPLCVVVCFCVLLALWWMVFSEPSAPFNDQEGNYLNRPHNGKNKMLEWWKTGIIYQIYPRSFMDSNGDGIGDLKGIISKLDYLVYLNVGIIWLSPFYKSPMKDFGYDISDFGGVDPIFGTLQDFDRLVEEAHNKGLKVIVDFVPNHSSDQHEWFLKSCQRQAPYDNYYIWHDGWKDEDGKLQPPNNWLSVFGGSAWTWHKGRGQFYYRAFLPGQPDLNYRNPSVVKAMKNVVRYWLNKGVDGLRMDAPDVLFEATTLEDEPRSDLPNISSFHYAYLNHIYTESQPEIKDLIRGWREVLDEFQQKDGKARFMVIETYHPPEIRNRYYSYGGIPFNFDLVEELKAPLSGIQIGALVQKQYSNLPTMGWPTFVLGNHDRKRVSDRYGEVYVEALNILLLTLKGTPCTYYGEELGMKDINVTFEQTQDPWGRNFGPDYYQLYSRDPVRSPMQWDTSPYSGFTSGSSTWLPVHPEYAKRNVKVQWNSATQTSLQTYAAVAKLRQQPAFQTGELVFAVTSDTILSYVRQQTGNHGRRYLVVLNFGLESSKNNYSGYPVKSTKGVVVQGTSSVIDKLKVKEIGLTDLELKPGDGLIIKLP